MHPYTLAELQAMPTLSVGQTADLKIDDPHFRVWLCRTTVEDGEPFNNAVMVKRLIDGRWVEVDKYQAL